jgi:hypothetical protein
LLAIVKTRFGIIQHIDDFKNTKDLEIGHKFKLS